MPQSKVKINVEVDAQLGKREFEDYLTWVSMRSKLLKESYRQATGKDPLGADYYRYLRQEYDKAKLQFDQLMDHQLARTRENTQQAERGVENVTGKFRSGMTSALLVGGLVAKAVQAIIKLIFEAGLYLYKTSNSVKNFWDNIKDTISGVTKGLANEFENIVGMFVSWGKVIGLALTGNFKEARLELESLRDTATGIVDSVGDAVDALKLLRKIDSAAKLAETSWLRAQRLYKTEVEKINDALENNPALRQDLIGKMLAYLNLLQIEQNSYITALQRVFDEKLKLDLSLKDIDVSGVKEDILQALKDPNAVESIKASFSALASGYGYDYPETYRMLYKNLLDIPDDTILAWVDAYDKIQLVREEMRKYENEYKRFVILAQGKFEGKGGAEITTTLKESVYKSPEWYSELIQALQNRLNTLAVGSEEYRSILSAIYELQTDLARNNKFPKSLSDLIQLTDELDESMSSVAGSIAYLSNKYEEIDSSSVLLEFRGIIGIFGKLGMNITDLQTAWDKLHASTNPQDKYLNFLDFIKLLNSANEEFTKISRGGIDRAYEKVRGFLELINRPTQSNLSTLLNEANAALKELDVESFRYLALLRQVISAEDEQNKILKAELRLRVGSNTARLIKEALDDSLDEYDAFYDYVVKHYPELDIDIENSTLDDLTDLLNQYFRDAEWKEQWIQIKADRESMERVTSGLNYIATGAATLSAAFIGLNSLQLANYDIAKKNNSVTADQITKMRVMTKTIAALTIAEQVAAAASAVYLAVKSSKTWYEAIAAVASSTGAVLGALATAKSQIHNQGYAEGGIVQGQFQTGDKQTIRVNAGEMVLTTQQQKNLFSMLNNGGVGGGGLVEFTIKGKDLVGVLNNTNRYNNLTK